MSPAADEAPGLSHARRQLRYAELVIAFRTIFLIVLFAGLAVQLWLAVRQIRHVEAKREAVPGAFRGRIPLEAHEKAADYTVARQRLGIVADLAGVGVLLAWTIAGGLDALVVAWDGAGMPALATGLLLLLSVIVLDSLPGLLFSIYGSFVIEERFGFNRTTPRTFAADAAKGVVLTLALAAPLAAGALWLIDSGGALWWLWAWIGWTAVSFGLAWAYPVYIAPLFNKFTPLADEELRRDIEALLGRCGFRSSGIFVMDGSRRSTHGNAYFTGFGSAKRIVFFDTLLSGLSTGQILAVLAHELGHFRLRHVLKQMALSSGAALAALALLAWLLGQGWFYRGLGVTHETDGAALALLLLVGPAFAFFVTPLFAALSRRFEADADGYAAEKADAADLASALVSMYEQNATTLTPDPLHSAFYDSHPAAAVRVAQLERLAAERAKAPAVERAR